MDQKAEEIVLTVISSLMDELQTGAGFERVAAKFVENEFEKSDRLMELYFMFAVFYSFTKNESLLTDIMLE